MSAQLKYRESIGEDSLIHYYLYRFNSKVRINQKRHLAISIKNLPLMAKRQLPHSLKSRI